VNLLSDLLGIRSRPIDVMGRWDEQWETALACWSRFTRLSRPRWCLTRSEEELEGLRGSFAMIRLNDHAVVISLRQICERGLEGFGVEIMAHEIGHHVLCPADLRDQGRMLARMRAALPTKEHLAALVANLYADLLINNRLQRSAERDMSGVYKALGKGSSDPLWTVYMRIYEILWREPRGSLAAGKISPELEGDAQLGARLVRVYGRDWMRGAGRFAALMLPYLLEDEGAEVQQLLEGWLDTLRVGQGGDPGGLAEIDDEELEGAIHPSLDPALNGLGDQDEDEDAAAEDAAEERVGGSAGRETGLGGHKKVDRYRGPMEYGELLDALGVGLSAEEVAVRYYRERAMPHLIRFPYREARRSTEPLMEGLEIWDVGSPLQRADWLQSVIRSPYVVPGMTTVQRTWGTTEGADPERKPLDLYIGIDCSGSMPNPGRQVSFPTLAGSIMALSALRAGARVKVVLSGEPGSSVATEGFLRTEAGVLRILTGYLGTGYGFGIHRLDETFGRWETKDPATHILIITDQDIFSMLDGLQGERLGWTVAAEAMQKARGGATFVMHMPGSWEDQNLRRMEEIGWDIHRLYDWQELVAFARTFSRKTYGEPAT
jgi:hypothetical protein